MKICDIEYRPTAGRSILQQTGQRHRKEAKHGATGRARRPFCHQPEIRETSGGSVRRQTCSRRKENAWTRSRGAAYEHGVHSTRRKYQAILSYIWRRRIKKFRSWNYLKYITRFQSLLYRADYLFLPHEESYASAVLGVVILSVRPSVRLSVRLPQACIVTKLNNALQIFWYRMKRQSLCYSDTNAVGGRRPLPSKICS